MKKTPVNEEKSKFDFGNYYEDILPDDTDEVNTQSKDNKLVIRLAILGFFVLVALSACIALLVLLGGE
jgi:type IV secretory pathway component VirB8